MVFILALAHTPGNSWIFEQRLRCRNPRYRFGSWKRVLMMAEVKKHHRLALVTRPVDPAAMIVFPPFDACRPPFLYFAHRRDTSDSVRVVF
jgi:hypothetical protein